MYTITQNSILHAEEGVSITSNNGLIYSLTSKNSRTLGMFVPTTFMNAIGISIKNTIQTLNYTVIKLEEQ